MEGAKNEPTVGSQRHFEGKLINVRIDTVQLPNGRLRRREIVEHSDCVCIVPLDTQGNVHLVRQYRKPVESFLLELPAGGIDQGESPDDAAHRELEEETGLKAEQLEKLTFFWMTPGWSTEGMHAYLAQGLRPGPQRAEDDEDIEVVKVPLSDAPRLIAEGQILDAKSIASLMMVYNRLVKSEK